MKKIRSFCPVCGGGTVIGVDHEQRHEEELTWEKLAEFLTKYGEGEIQHLRAANAELRRLLMWFVQNETAPCSFDHHGNCQEHGWVRGDAGSQECIVPLARRTLGLEVYP